MDSLIFISIKLPLYKIIDHKAEFQERIFDLHKNKENKPNMSMWAHASTQIFNTKALKCKAAQMYTPLVCLA